MVEEEEGGGTPKIAMATLRRKTIPFLTVAWGRRLLGQMLIYPGRGTLPSSELRTADEVPLPSLSVEGSPQPRAPATHGVQGLDRDDAAIAYMQRARK